MRVTPSMARPLVVSVVSCSAEVPQYAPMRVECRHGGKPCCKDFGKSAEEISYQRYFVPGLPGGMGNNAW